MKHLSTLRSAILLTAVCCLQVPFVLADTAANIPGQEPRIEAVETEEGADSTPKWDAPLSEGSDRLFYFVEAVSGKKLKPVTYDLLRGVREVVIEKKRILFKRSDDHELEISDSTEGGAKFYRDWEKSKINLEDKFGKSGKEFLENIGGVKVNGDRIEIQRSGPEVLVVELGDRKIHPAFDLRGLRFRKLSMQVDKTDEFPFLSNIQGVSAVIRAPGFSFPVDVKEFSKKKLEKENDIRVGVRNPVPGPFRALLFMPSIFRFHFRLARKVN